MASLRSSGLPGKFAAVEACDATGDATTTNAGLINVFTMLIEKNFYTIEAFSNESETVKATVAINKLHEVFDGHFPGKPVVPGVCMTQMVKELTEKAVDKKLLLAKADQLKFLSVINPAENNIATIEVKYKVAENMVDVNATITNTAATCFKMKAQFTVL